jgi:hypothetical protein
MWHTLFLGLLTLAVGASVANAQYTYSEPILARDSGLTCVGVTLNDEQNLDREPHRGANNHKTTNGLTIEVLCPLTRRNLVPYGQDPATSEWRPEDDFLIQKVTIFVNARSPADALSCSVYGYSVYNDRIIESPRRYACTVEGGCTTPPVRRNPGYRTLIFNFPLGSTSRFHEAILNIGYKCSIPNGRSAVIGAEAEFKKAIN